MARLSFFFFFFTKHIIVFLIIKWVRPVNWLCEFESYCPVECRVTTRRWSIPWSSMSVASSNFPLPLDVCLVDSCQNRRGDADGKMAMLIFVIMGMLVYITFPTSSNLLRISPSDWFRYLTISSKSRTRYLCSTSLCILRVRYYTILGD